MKNFCTQILLKGQLNYGELVTFITEYLELNNKKFESTDIERIIQTIQMGAFDIIYAVKTYCRMKNYTIYTISKENQVIKIWIE